MLQQLYTENDVHSQIVNNLKGGGVDCHVCGCDTIPGYIEIVAVIQ